MVTALCRALLRDRTEAEDAAQQVFLSAHRSLLNGAEPREAPAWLATIARNECWSRISGRMREPLSSDAADDVPGTADPVAEAIRRADLAALWRAIRLLPTQQREALLLREFGGLRYDELAAALSVTEPAVESLLFRARARLRTQLETAAAALAPLARLLASGGGPAVAVKAAALGLGAAAVTGTAVVAPTVLERHPHNTQATSSPPVQAARDAAPLAVLQLRRAPTVVHHRVERVAETATEPERHDGGRTAATDERHDGGRTTTPEPEGRDGGGTATTSSHDGGRDSGSTSSGPGPSGSPSGSESESGSGSASGDGDRHGGTTTAATTTTTTGTTSNTLPPLPTVTVTDVERSGGSVSGSGSDGSSGHDGSGG